MSRHVTLPLMRCCFFRRSLCVILSATFVFSSSLIASYRLLANQSQAGPQQRQDQTVQSDAESMVIETNKAIERELAGGQVHSYQIMLTTGQYLHMIAEQHGIDVVVTLFGPDGKKLIEVDGPTGTEGAEPLMWITESHGRFRLEIRPPGKEVKAGRYKVRIVELRAASETDRTLTEALRLLNESANLGYKGNLSEAIPLAERALRLRESALGSDHSDTASSLYNLAALYHDGGEYTKAEMFYQRALTIWEKTLSPDHLNVALSLYRLAGIYRIRSEYTKAEMFYQRALTIREKALGSNHSDVASSLDSLAILYHNKGDYMKAEPLHLRALEIREKTLDSDHPHIALSFNNLAVLYRDSGEYAKAEMFYQKASTLR